MSGIKQFIKNLPLVGGASRRIYRGIVPRRPARFERSAAYWEERYRSGGTSGSGSYNRLAKFKADVLNTFVRERAIRSVIEFGCGDGAQLLLADYPRYIGIDVSPTAIDTCKTLYKRDDTKSFFTIEEMGQREFGELGLSLDVIYHLVEDEVFDGYMKLLFERSTRFVSIYASNEEQAGTPPHVRHRRFTDWVELHCRDWRLVQSIENPYPFVPEDPANTSHSKFFFYERERQAS